MPTVDLTTGAGRAIVELFRSIKEDIEQSDGGWPGADVVQALTGWFTGLGIDPELPADDLPGVNPNHCPSCGAHLAGPHGPGCPVDADLDHDDPGGRCDGADITVAYNAPVQVTVGGSTVRHVLVDHAAGEVDPVVGGQCAGCDRSLPIGHPAVAAAITVVENDRTWRSWDVPL